MPVPRSASLLDTSGRDPWSAAFLVDAEDFSILGVDDEAIRVYGYSREEFYQLSILDLHFPDDQSRAQKFLHAGEQRDADSIWRHRFKDGSEVKVTISTTRIVSRGSTLISCRVSSCPLGLRTALALRQVDERSRAVFINSVVAISIRGQDGRLIDANDAYCRLFGYAYSELLDLELQDLMDPEDYFDDCDLLTVIAKGLRGPSVVDRRYIGKGRRRITTRESIAVTRRPDGSVDAFIRVSVDLSTEQALAHQLDSANAQLRVAGACANLGGWSLDLASDSVQLTDELQDLLCLSDNVVPLQEWLAMFEGTGTPSLSSSIKTCISERSSFELSASLRKPVPKGKNVRIAGQFVLGCPPARSSIQGIAMIIHQSPQQGLSTGSGVGHVLLHQDERIAYLDDIAAFLLGSSGGDALGKQLYDVCDQGLAGLIEPWIREFSQTGEQSLHLGFVPGSGRWMAFEASFHDSRLLLKIRDLSGIISSVLALSRHKACFRGFAEASPLGVWEYQVSNRESWRNLCFDRSYGFDFQRGAEKPFLNTWSERIHPEDRSRVLQSFREVLSQPSPVWLGRYRLMVRTGDYVAVHHCAYLIRDAEGTISRILSVFAPCASSNLQGRLSMYSALFDLSKYAVITCDAGFRITSWNSGAEYIYGWSAAEIMGESINRIMDGDSVAISTIVDSLQSLRRWDGKLYQTTRGLGKISCQSLWLPLQLGPEEATAYLIINSNPMEGSADASGAGGRVQRLESLGMLISGITHDLNNLLTPISMAADLLQKTVKEPSASSLLKNIAKSAKRGGDLVQQVVEIAKGSDGNPILLQLNHIVREVEGILVSGFSPDIRLSVSVNKDAWPLRGDPAKLYQVVLNLCVNAKEAMPDGGTIYVSTCNFCVDEDFAATKGNLRPGNYVLLEVADEGAGIEPSKLEAVFQPFFSTKNGSGIGLSTVADIVRSYSGYIEVDSKVGKGSVFRIYFPAEAHGFTAVEDDTVVQEGADLNGNGATVLLVDDEDVFLQVTRHTLEASGFKTIIARNGAEAIALYAQHREEIAVVVLDWMMPVMSGDYLYSAIKNINPAQKMIISTGVDVGDLIGYMDNDRVHVIQKPFTAGVLIGLIKEKSKLDPRESERERSIQNDEQ